MADLMRGKMFFFEDDVLFYKYYNVRRNIHNDPHIKLSHNLHKHLFKPSLSFIERDSTEVRITQK
jgi:hypothetical protein